MAEGWKGGGQELGKSWAELDRCLARHPGQAQGGGRLRALRRGLSMGTAVWDGALHSVSFLQFLEVF